MTRRACVVLLLFAACTHYRREPFDVCAVVAGKDVNPGYYIQQNINGTPVVLYQPPTFRVDFEWRDRELGSSYDRRDYDALSVGDRVVVHAFRLYDKHDQLAGVDIGRATHQKCDGAAKRP